MFFKKARSAAAQAQQFRRSPLKGISTDKTHGGPRFVFTEQLVVFGGTGVTL
jgi:hypothetical protein